MQKESKKRVVGSRGIIACGIALILIPVTIGFAWRFFEKNYEITSWLIVLYTLVPLWARFEKRKPQAKEFITLVVMCAIAIGCRAAFVWVEHFKPMAAIIIMTGVALGAEAGLLTGAFSVLISNMMFGHGPWTPWQMFAFGFAGYLAGMCEQYRLIQKENKIKLAAFGGVAIMVFVGPLLDTATLFLMPAKLTKDYVLGTYMSGMPVNAIHALATILTIYFVSQPLFEKLDRMKTKYGMMEG